MTLPPPSRAPSLLAGLALMLVPLMVLAENAMPDVWKNRLFEPLYQAEPNRHTPARVKGTYLPPTVTASTTYTTAQSPLFLTGTTHVPAGVTVTLEPGVLVQAHEFATLNIAGTLIAAGTPERRVTFTTNEVHPDNKTWNGIVVADGGQARLTHTLIEYASPALTCAPASAVAADRLHTRYGLVGLYTESSACALTNSRLQALHYGIVAIDHQPSATSTTISSGKENIKAIKRLETNNNSDF